MPSPRRSHLRTASWLAAAALLALAVIGIVVELQARADAGRDAQVRLARVVTELQALQELPWEADVEEGGDPRLVRTQLEAGERRIRGTLAELRGRSAPPQLAAVQGPLETNVAALERARASVAAEQFERAGKWNSAAERSAAAAGRALDAAGAAYEARAAASLRRATAGSVAAIVALLAAFGWFFLRSVRARATAERLAAENQRLLAASREEALTDALTGLANRRALLRDLQAALTSTSTDQPLVLALFDLDGFKEYNDTFGHPAGDALLAQLGEQLVTTLEGIGGAYRMGGDEFCVLAQTEPGGGDAIARLAAAALSSEGDAFRVGCSYGTALLPAEAGSPEAALRLADRRMYEQKASGRRSASRQSTDVLLKVLGERSSELEEHIGDVAHLAQLTAERLGLARDEVRRVRLAAELHDVGKTAIPDAILDKPGPLDEEQWAFMRRHTLIGERIISAAPSLAYTADLVRSSHERLDGAGYPDGLSGDDIPLGARIITVCDAFDAMVSDRPYRRAMEQADALAELRRCSGTQFDPAIVAAFTTVVEEQGLPAATPARAAA